MGKSFTIGFDFNISFSSAIKCSFSIYDERPHCSYLSNGVKRDLPQHNFQIQHTVLNATFA